MSETPNHHAADAAPAPAAAAAADAPRRKASVARTVLPLLAASALGIAPALGHADEPAPSPDAGGSSTPAPAAEPAPGPAPAPEPADDSGAAGLVPAAPVAPAPGPVGTPAPTAPATGAPGITRSPDGSDENTIVVGSAPRRPKASGDERDAAPTLQATDQTLVAPNLLTMAGIGSSTIDDFDIPPFLLPIYQAAGSAYGIPWPVLASINHIETNFGRNLNVSSAGALGWMQFMPSTWDMYGVDAGGDGVRDPYNPADAIFAAARYLKAAGGQEDLRKAIWAYNHADWYVNQVLEGAQRIAALPAPMIDALTGLTEGIFPIDAPAAAVRYDGEIDVTPSSGRVPASQVDAPRRDEAAGDRQAAEIATAPGARVVAVQDGVIEAVGRDDEQGAFIRMRDAYGNRYTYTHLGHVQAKVPVLREQEEDSQTHAHDESEPAAADGDAPESTTPDADAVPATSPEATTPAEPEDQDAAPTDASTPGPSVSPSDRLRPNPTPTPTPTPTPDSDLGERVTPIANPPLGRIGEDAAPAEAADPKPTSSKSKRRHTVPTSPDDFAPGTTTDQAIAKSVEAAAGGDPSLADAPGDSDGPADGTIDLADYFSIDYDVDPSRLELKRLTVGRRVVAGTVLGYAARATDEPQPIGFEIRPAGKDAPRIDPTPFLNGWRLSDATDFFAGRARTTLGEDTGDASRIGQILLMSKQELGRRVLADQRISIYECGRNDIRAGQIDRRVLALLEVLAERGVEPVVTSLRCGHGLRTSSGNISEHSTGDAVDIASAYGTVITPATQGPGSVTDRAVREILQLQGSMRPHQIITLHAYAGYDNTLAMADHDDHIHVGFRPDGVSTPAASSATGAMTPEQWKRLAQRIGGIESPTIPATPPTAASADDADAPAATTPR